MFKLYDGMFVFASAFYLSLSISNIAFVSKVASSCVAVTYYALNLLIIVLYIWIFTLITHINVNPIICRQYCLYMFQGRNIFVSRIARNAESTSIKCLVLCDTVLYLTMSPSLVTFVSFLEA